LFLPSPSEARARQQSPKIRILKIGGTFWTKSEPISPKILTLTFDCRPTGDNPAQRFRPPPLCFGEQNRKIFLTFFNCAPPKFFSIKETKIFLFCLPADAGIAETLSHSQPAFGGQSRRAKIPSPRPPSFLPACLGFAQIFLRRKIII